MGCGRERKGGVAQAQAFHWVFGKGGVALRWGCDTGGVALTPPQHPSPDQGLPPLQLHHV